MDTSTLTPLLVRLIRSGLSAQPDPATAASVSALPPQDWEALVTLANRHDLTPLLHAGTVACGPTTPSLAQALRMQAYASELRNSRTREQLERLIAALNAHEIVPVLLKGALFAFHTYPTPGMRSFSDIDILVPLAERAQAAEVLTALGYRDYRSPDGREQSWWTENHHHWIYVPEQGLAVELHWALTPPRSSVQFDTERLWRQSQEIACPGGRGRRFQPEDTLLYLASHIATHQLELPLRNLVDLAVLLANAPGLDWDATWRQAADVRAETDLALVLGIADTLQLISLSEALRADVRKRTPVRIPWADLARYAVEWPFFDKPHSLVAAFSRASLGTRWNTIRKALFPDRARPRSTESQAPPEPATHPAPSPQKPTNRRSQKIARLASSLTNTRSAVTLNRLLGDREAP
ncbi:MAG TPA: nucleotidyltransferase family protein [Chthonomonadaceae bacterium]|nr:nucleotidyltransferase family protein [Chthonomonadaceae bacterium]